MKLPIRIYFYKMFKIDITLHETWSCVCTAEWHLHHFCITNFAEVTFSLPNMSGCVVSCVKWNCYNNFITTTQTYQRRQPCEQIHKSKKTTSNVKTLSSWASDLNLWWVDVAFRRKEKYPQKTDNWQWIGRGSVSFQISCITCSVAS